MNCKITGLPVVEFEALLHFDDDALRVATRVAAIAPDDFVQPSDTLPHLNAMNGMCHPGAPRRDAMELFAFVMLSALVLNLVKEIVPERW